MSSENINHPMILAARARYTERMAELGLPDVSVVAASEEVTIIKETGNQNVTMAALGQTGLGEVVPSDVLADEVLDQLAPAGVRS